MQRLDPKASVLVVVDVQERLASVMPPSEIERLQRAATILLTAAPLLGVSVLRTEQYPKGLGPTLPALQALLDQAGARSFEKTAFSACDAGGFLGALEATGARAAVVVGMEAHICVYQTVRDLVQRGLEVHVPIDGVVSRREDHRDVGLALCERAGAVRTTAETVAFDWLGGSGTEAFKAISRVVK